MKTRTTVALVTGTAAVVGGVAFVIVRKEKQDSYNNQAKSGVIRLANWMNSGFDPRSRDAFDLRDLDSLEIELRRANDPALKRELEAFVLMKPALIRIVEGEDPKVVAAELAAALTRNAETVWP